MLRNWKKNTAQTIAVTSLALIVILFLRPGWAQKGEGTYPPGLLSLRSMQAFGPLEFPPVLFDHDQHTRELGQEGEKCETCHPQINANFVFTFQEVHVSDSEAAQNLYHTQCVQCHRSRQKLGKSSGPLEGKCRSCHQKEKAPLPSQYNTGMNLALHAEHIQAQNGTCDQCHHEYDRTNKKRVYVEGKELGCRACHLQEEGHTALSSLAQAPSSTLFEPAVSSHFLNTETTPSWPQAAHLSCLNCHLRTRPLASKDASQQPPLSCRGCHGDVALMAYEQEKKVPRLKRGQPDTLFISASKADIRDLLTLEDKEGSGLMKPVPFDHKAHEAVQNTCRDCHHQSRLEPCSQCHTLQGAAKGEMIPLTQAMHSPESSLSCQGCHQQKLSRQKECVGCHGFMQTRSPLPEDTCHLCHDGRGPEQRLLLDMPVDTQSRLAMDLLTSQEEDSSPIQPQVPDRLTISLHSDQFGSLSFPVHLSEKEQEQMAQGMSLPREEEPKDPLAAMPEEVTIDSISDQYGPVTLPHAQIADALDSGIADSALAQAFHSSRLTLCQGCHHNSQPSENPPACRSCHSRPFAPERPKRMGLKAAYHAQCMDCHQRMQIAEPANTDCTACHERQRKRIIGDIK